MPSNSAIKQQARVSLETFRSDFKAFRSFGPGGLSAEDGNMRREDDDLQALELRQPHLFIIHTAWNPKGMVDRELKASKTNA